MYSAWEVADASQNQYIRHNGSIYESIQAICCEEYDKETQKHFYRYYINMFYTDIDEYGDEGKELMVSTYGHHLPDLIEKYGDKANDIVASCFIESRCVKDVRSIDVADSREQADEIIRNYINI